MSAVEIAFLLVGMAVLVLAGAAVADRIHLPAPLLLIVVGVGVSYLPFVPTIHLEAEVVLLGLLPPLLYAAAIHTSLVDFNANRLNILLLSVVLVVVTTVAVGAVVRMLLPDLGWAGALAIGAVVAPPDAVAATAIGRRIGLPRQVVTVLEGESLLNDATALVSLRTAVAALAATEAVSASHVALDFLRAAGGGVLFGVALFVIVARVRRRIHDPLLDTAVSFTTPFAAYVLAEKVEASGVIAVVICGLLLGHKAPIIQSAQSRISERMNWRTIAFVLENTVFLLIGLQAGWILGDVVDSEVSLGRVALICLATLVTVIAVRMAFTFAARPVLNRRTASGMSTTNTALVGWAGMRGVVTLAAAFVIPEETAYREVLLLVAFTVVAGTLFLQGLTLPRLARALGAERPDPVADALTRATLLQQASSAGLERLDQLEHDDPHGVGDLIRQRIDQRNFAAWERLSTAPGEETPSGLYARARLDMIDAERAKVLEVRSTGSVPSDIVAEVLTMLDVEESMLDVATESRDELDAARAVVVGDLCAHLSAFPAVETEPDAVCAPCVEEGIRWVSLRQCLECGIVRCCDSSPRRHATAHFQEEGHPVVQSAQPGESWRWCYVDELTG